MLKIDWGHLGKVAHWGILHEHITQMYWINLAFVGHAEVVKKILDDYPHLELFCGIRFLIIYGNETGFFTYTDMIDSSIEFQIGVEGSKDHVESLDYDTLLKLPQTPELLEGELLALICKVLKSSHDSEVTTT